jgi:uncharacterized protein YbaR (Trm112 family)
MRAFLLFRQETGMDEFGAHIAAAKAGCPVCKMPLDDLKAEHAETGWRNRCLNPRCSGIREYVITYEVRHIDEKAPASRRHGTTESTAVKAAEGWTYCDDYNRWRDIKGSVVKLKELTDDELLDAMYALKEANFAKRGSTIDWMKDLPRKPGKHSYPLEGLRVGKDKALSKLEELQEVAVERGLFGISS